MLLSRVLPFDDEDDKEIARQTIQDAADFSFHPWEKVSQAAQDVCKALLEKSRQKRATIEQVLNMDWFNDYKEVSQARREASPETRFKAYTLTQNGAAQIQAEIKQVKANQLQEEEKKE